MTSGKHIIRTVSTIVALLAGICLCNAQSTRYIDALRAYQQGETAEAKSLFGQEMAENPANDAAYYYSALLLMTAPDGKLPTEADVKQAEDYFKKALELSPDNFWYKYYLSIFYADTDRMELSIKLLEELIADNPKRSSLYFDAVNAYLNQKDIDKALSTIDKIDKIAGHSEMIGITKMELMLKKDPSNPTAAYDFLTAYFSECRTPRIAVMLGDYNMHLYRDSLALSYYDEAIEMDDDYSPAYYGRAHVYQALRQYDNYFSDMHHFLGDPDLMPEAKAEYLNNIISSPQFVQAFPAEIDTMMNETYRAHPTDSSVCTTVGVYYYRTERPDVALELLRQNAESHPDSYTAAFQHLLVLYYCERWEPVADEATVMLQKFGESSDVRQLRAIASWQLNNYDDALDDYRTIAAGAPKDSATIVFTNTAMGDIYHQKGDAKKAYQCYDKVLKVAPDYAPVLNNYAYYLCLEGRNLKKALSMSRKTIEQEPDNATYIDTYAWILHLMGNDLDAKAHFKHAMLYGGTDSAEILNHYAEVLYSLKEYDLAYIYWNKAKAVDVDGKLKLDDKIRERKAQQNK